MLKCYEIEFVKIDWVVSWPVAFEKSTQKPHILPTTSSRNRVHKSEAKLYHVQRAVSRCSTAWRFCNQTYTLSVSKCSRTLWLSDMTLARSSRRTFGCLAVVKGAHYFPWLVCVVHWVAKLIKGPGKHEKTMWNPVTLFSYPGHSDFDPEQNLPLHSSMQNCCDNCLVNENVHA